MYPNLGESFNLMENAKDMSIDSTPMATTAVPTPSVNDGAMLNTLTKAELAEMIFERVGLNKREAKEIVDLFFDEIRDALVQGDSVKLSGFGNFTLRDKPQRPGRNPKTGEIIPIAARRVVTFHASQKLKAMVEGISEAELKQREAAELAL